MPRTFSVRRTIADLPIPRKLTLMMGLFCIVVIGLLLLSYFGMNMMSGSRAFIEGEALYSKAQKSAVHRLTRYALLHEENDYQEYLKYISIPLGDHDARLELSRFPVNEAAAGRGFIQGRNHPADVGLLIWMPLHLHQFYYMHKAIDLWRQADDCIEQLQQVAIQLHAEIASGHPLSTRVQSFLNDIQDIDARLTPAEDEFSFTLAEGARWLKKVLLSVMVLATLLFLTLALTISVLISKHMSNEIEHLRLGASRIAGGDYEFNLHTDAMDEIGDLARTFQKMAAERQLAERLKDEFFANVSHELRTPLTLILSPLESLLDGDYGEIAAGVKPALEIMHNNTVRLLQLVNGLLDFSKLEAGQIRVHRESLNIAEITQMVYKDFQPMMQKRNFETQIQTVLSTPYVLMDRYLYERIIFNLLSNAVKFTPIGGRIEILLKQDGEQLTLTVADTGMGIPAHELDNIFKRFHQVEGSSTRRFEGTGLGLSLVKEFAGLLDGTVSATSTLGKGSVFTLTCAAPSSPAPVLSINPAQESWSMHAQRYNTAASAPLKIAASESKEALPKVLIAEDNLEMSAYIETLLFAHCQIKTARNGNKALKIVEEWGPDLILTDVMMPESDGLSLCRAVKTNPTTAAIPVVMLTALTHREALLEGWKAGANEYLFKPFHPLELTTRIKSLLQAREDQKQSAEKIAQLNENLKRHVKEVTTANMELEAFSYSVSHDLRSPLRSINGFSKELLDHHGAQLDARGKEDLMRIRAATQRMGHLIDDLLELSQLSRHELTRETVDMSKLVIDIMDKLKSDHTDRQVQCAVHPGVIAQGDLRLLQIALGNLIQNSWKFTRQEKQAKIEFGVTQQEGKTVFFIRDNGAGFNMEYANKLFKPFQRLHDAKEYPGTGIGLALTQRIIQRHGGEIWTEAEEHRGATFFFTL